jgi:hypothetical protein
MEFTMQSSVPIKPMKATAHKNGPLSKVKKTASGRQSARVQKVKTRTGRRQSPRALKIKTKAGGSKG